MPLRTCLMPLMAVATILLARNVLPAEPEKLTDNAPAVEATPSPGKPVAEPPTNATVPASVPARPPAGGTAPAPTPAKPIGGTAAPAPVAPKPSSDPAAIVQSQPHFFVHVDVDHANRQYEEGDSLHVSVQSEADAYLHVVYRQADGKVFQIFPNSGQRENRIQARQTVQIPASTGLFTWIVGPPFGKEVIKVIATKEPLERLSDPQLRQLRFNPVSGQDIQKTHSELTGMKGAWTEDMVEITTFAHGHAPPPAGARRFALFVGVGEYEFNDVEEEFYKDLDKAGKWDQADGPPTGPNTPSATNNCELMAKIFRRYAQLADSKVLLNRDATREKLGKAIQWLADVSHEGDTVFIYHCGHGGRLAGDPRNGAGSPAGDKPTYFLCPYESASYGTIVALMAKKKKDGSLEPALERRLQQLLAVACEGGFPDKADTKTEATLANQRMVSVFNVTANEYGRWVQMLSGRQVVVILETCHSGGFATREPEGVQGVSDEKGFEFNFLAPQLGRLKDIGQPESALLSACLGRETALASTVPEDELERLIATHAEPHKVLLHGLAGWFLAVTIEGSPGPLLLDEDFEKSFLQRTRHYCDLHQQAFPKANRIVMHPRLFNYCSRAIVLKP